MLGSPGVAPIGKISSDSSISISRFEAIALWPALRNLQAPKYIYIYTRRSSALKRALTRSSRSQDLSPGRSYPSQGVLEVSQGSSDLSYRGSDPNRGSRHLR